MISAKNIPIVIVAYRNPKDVTECLEALQRSASDPEFDAYICENGGATAFGTLVSAVAGAGGPCDRDERAGVVVRREPTLYSSRSHAAARQANNRVDC